MPLLPIEAEAGVQFGYFAEDAAIKLDAVKGLYLKDAVNGTVYAGKALAASRRVLVSQAAESGDNIDVTVTVQDHDEVTVAAVAALEVLILGDDGLPEDNVGVTAVGTGTAVTTVGAGATHMIINTDAAGVAVFTCSQALGATEDAHLLVRVLNAPSEKAYELLAYDA